MEIKKDIIMTKYVPPKLPPEFNGMRCDICGTNAKLKVTMQLTSDPPIPCEWRCEECLKAIKEAQEQKRYLKKLRG